MMLFLDVAKCLTDIIDAPDDQAIAILADLFQQTSFGEASLLLALCSQKPPWQMHPWLTKTVPEELLILAKLPGSHTLARVFGEMQRIAKAHPSISSSHRQVLLAGLDSLSAGIAEQLLDGTRLVRPTILEAALTDTRWRVGVPVLPEKLVRCTSEETKQVWQTLGVSYGHVKDDGYYCQLHKLNHQILLFVGANLLEQTELYPEVVEAGRSLINATSVILEGELVGLNSARQVLPRREMSQAVSYQIRLFDLLGVNGNDWRTRPYKFRRERRLSLVSDQPDGAICHAREFAINSAGTLITLFGQCRTEGWEGLVVKQAEARYCSNARNPACIKLKLVEPIDATIIGYFLTASGDVETFLLALYNQETGQFEACGRTRAGLSLDEQRTVQTLVATDIGYDPAMPIVANESPDVWVKPHLIFEFLADYRHPSDRYPCAHLQTGQGWVLHNPVFRSAEPRPDKDGHQTTTIDQFLKLRVEAGQILPRPSSQANQSHQELGQQLSFPWRKQE